MYYNAVMDLKQLIRDHLKTPRTMSLSTSVDNKPWNCTVHYFNDDDFNFYWISTPERRHSKEIEQNKNAAIAIKVHEDTPQEKYVIGISAEGTAELIDNEEIKKIGTQYTTKLGKPDSLIADILEGRNPHKFYKFTPTNIVLFDYKNFKNSPRQEISL